MRNTLPTSLIKGLILLLTLVSIQTAKAQKEILKKVTIEPVLLQISSPEENFPDLLEYASQRLKQMGVKIEHAVYVSQNPTLAMKQAKELEKVLEEKGLEYSISLGFILSNPNSIRNVYSFKSEIPFECVAIIMKVENGAIAQIPNKHNIFRGKNFETTFDKLDKAIKKSSK